MTVEHDPLWLRLQSLQIDTPGAEFTFTQRLARENHWSESFAQRVVHEYLRFIYLATVAGHPVTPSDEVDQAWHLHLVYTRSYWDDLCRNILGKPLHHGPTKGGHAEAAKFDDWYARTKQSYKRLFGQAPPQDIWPPANIRFAPADRFKRIDSSAHWIIPKRLTQHAALWSSTAFILASCIIQPSNKNFFPWGFFIIVAPAMMFFLILISKISRQNRKKRKRNDKGDGCSSFGAGGGCGNGCGSDSGSDSGGGGSSGCGGGGCGGGGD
ncbi:glycine-rich domain-containing protein [Phragmitibacter flavus]|uniref:glycine-rich domain-containing protein n=1 Tax=Phragmitibacter flavus TaxID=2576071 RepID=UPI001981240A|nr:hypothetical protein [Phragmitibacter flavus]